MWIPMFLQKPRKPKGYEKTKQKQLRKLKKQEVMQEVLRDDFAKKLQLAVKYSFKRIVNPKPDALLTIDVKDKRSVTEVVLNDHNDGFIIRSKKGVQRFSMVVKGDHSIFEYTIGVGLDAKTFHVIEETVGMLTVWTVFKL